MREIILGQKQDADRDSWAWQGPGAADDTCKNCGKERMDGTDGMEGSVEGFLEGTFRDTGKGDGRKEREGGGRLGRKGRTTARRTHTEQ
jgi:hypothetical protein